MIRIRYIIRKEYIYPLSSDIHTFTPIAIAVLSLTSSPNLKEPPFISLTKISGTLLDEAKLGRCFVSHRGLQSEANSTAYKLKKRNIVLFGPQKKMC